MVVVVVVVAVAAAAAVVVVVVKSLCLTKHYDMKTICCLIKLHTMKAYWESVCIAPRILNLGTRRR
jgi:hypothetical protein